MVPVSLLFSSTSFIILDTFCHWLPILDSMLSLTIQFSLLWFDFFFPNPCILWHPNCESVCNETVQHFVNSTCAVATGLSLFASRSVGSLIQTSLRRVSNCYCQCKFSPRSAVWRMALLSLICWYFSWFNILDHVLGMLLRSWTLPHFLLPSWLYSSWVLTVLSSLLYLSPFQLFIKWLTSVTCNSFLVSQEELSREFCRDFLLPTSNTSCPLPYSSSKN